MSNKTAAVTSGPARLPRPASSAPAMKRRSKARSKANSFRPRGRFLGGPEPFRRPVGEEGSADDPVLLDRAPDAAVGGVPTVVAHHKKLAPRDRDGLRQVARFARFVRTNKWLLLLVEPSVLAFEEDAASLHVELVAPDADDALDEIGVRTLVDRLPTRSVVYLHGALDLRVVIGALRRLEHDDVAAVGVAEARRHPVDQDALADVERRLHRLARDPERLDEELLDAEGQPERDDDDDDELDERALALLRVLARCPAAGHWRRLSGHGGGSGLARLGAGFVGVRVRGLAAGALGVRVRGSGRIAVLRGVLGLAPATGLGSRGVTLGVGGRGPLLRGRGLCLGRL